MTNLIGQSLGRYHILEQLGEGGMATVYKAFDTRLERDVAVKIIRRNAFPPDQLDRILKRFEREAKSLARLSHPNIIKVIDYGEYNGAPYLVMEYMPGGTLKEKLKGRAMQWQEAVRLLIPIAQALEYAHEQKIIHRDIKPSNILLMQKGQPMLTDFGIAKILEVEEAATLTGTGVGIGTPEYMAPEQWTGSATAQTDIYSLGVVLYEMVTGRKPYTADTPAAILLKQATEPLPKPGKYVSDLPDSVEKILLKALARKPQDRYQDTGIFVIAMESLLMRAGQKPVPMPSVRKPLEPDLETQDTYLQEKKTSTESQTGTYIEVPRKTRTTQKINPHAASQPKKMVWWPWAVIIILLIFVIVVQNRLSAKEPLVLIITNTPNARASLAPPASAISPATETPTRTALPPSSATAELGIGSKQTGLDGMTLLYVPSGEFTMGSDVGDGDEKPVHSVYLDGYWIDQTEVTNGQYAACVTGGGCTAPVYSSSNRHSSYYGNAEFENYPVIYVDWYAANGYCKWVGRRLPTEAEWEKAARGVYGREYPWGNEAPNSGLSNYGGNFGDTTEVGKYPKGASLYGAYDMAGNVLEWVNDWHGGSYYQVSPTSNPMGPSSGEFRVLRGGSWYFYDYITRSAYRYRDDPTDTDFNFGFRCSRSQ